MTDSASAGTALPSIPGVFHSTEPAWNDQNLHELSEHISSSHFFAHVRAAIGSAVQQTNCHPFRHGRWLFMHNGYINEFDKIKRDLVLAVDPSLYPQIKGQADSEVLFYLALTLGLEDDPPSAIEQAIGLVEALGSQHGVADPFQGTIATTDGERTWAFRYASSGDARSLYYTTDVLTLRELYPDRELFAQESVDARLIVSEPLGEVAGVWNEVPTLPARSSRRDTTSCGRSGPSPRRAGARHGLTVAIRRRSAVADADSRASGFTSLG